MVVLLAKIVKTTTAIATRWWGKKGLMNRTMSGHVRFLKYSVHLLAVLCKRKKRKQKEKKGSLIPEDKLIVLNVAGILVGFRSRSRSTVNDPSFPSLISSCSGFKGSVTGFPNNSSTVATTLPDLQVKEAH